MLFKEKVGSAYEPATRKILREVYGMSTSEQDAIIAKGFSYTEAYVGLADKFCASITILASEIWKRYSVRIPSGTCNIVLHGEWNDLLITEAREALAIINPTEAEKALIAYELLCTIHRQHQREEAYAFSRKATYADPIPTPNKAYYHRIHPLDDLRFTPAELCGWEILSEHYIIIKTVMSMFGIAPDPKLVQKTHENAQRTLVRHHELRSGVALVEYIRNNRMSVVDSVDAKLRKGSAPRRLAARILDANPGLLALIR